MIEFALAYASKGWYVFPCYPMRGGICGCRRPQCESSGKHPANRRGLTDATTNEAQIRTWWEEMPDANIGVVMEPSGLLALDLDLYHKDLEKLAALERELGPLPSTVTQRSGSGEGFHALFASPGFPVCGVIGGIVVRSKAYIVVAPSNHESGKQYSWQEGLAPGDLPVAELPDTWKEALKKTGKVGKVGVPAEEPEWLAKVPQEQRIADMRAYFAKQPGEVKGTSEASTTFHVVRSAIRAHAVRDVNVALEAAMEFDQKCVPPWGARMGRHVWNAYQRNHSPIWGAAYHGEEQRLDELGLTEAAAALSSSGPPADILVRKTFEALSKSRTNDPEKLIHKELVGVMLKRGVLDEGNLQFAAQALIRNCPPRATEDQLAGYLIGCGVPDDKARDLLRSVQPTQNVVSIFDSLPTTSGPPVEGDDQTLLKSLKFEPNGEGLKGVPDNLAKILQGDSELKGKIRFNLLSKQIEVTAPRFADCTPNTLATGVMNWLSEKWQLVTARTSVEDQLLFVARQNDYNPIADYLNSLKWDGFRRIDTWLIDYCGAEDNEFNRRVSSMWLIAACARGIEPGSKVDNVLVLEGEQGAEKSTTLGVLAGDWFSDSPVAIGSKDAMQAAGSRWIIELAELAALRASENEAQKAFLSAREDNFRPPYGKAPENSPRFAIFGGSTNEDKYLSDTTGNRRYWPVKVGICDTLALRKVRDQLWAEAMFRYKSAELNSHLAHDLCPGERWWFDRTEDKEIAQPVVKKRKFEDTWAGLIREWMRHPRMVGAASRTQWTLAEIAKEALNIEIEKLPQKQRQITAAIKEAGLVPAEGPEGQAMWKVPDSDVITPGSPSPQESPTRPLQSAN